MPGHPIGRCRSSSHSAQQCSGHSTQNLAPIAGVARVRAAARRVDGLTTPEHSLCDLAVSRSARPPRAATESLLTRPPPAAKLNTEFLYRSPKGAKCLDPRLPPSECSSVHSSCTSSPLAHCPLSERSPGRAAMAAVAAPSTHLGPSPQQRRVRRRLRRRARQHLRGRRHLRRRRPRPLRRRPRRQTPLRARLRPRI